KSNQYLARASGELWMSTDGVDLTRRHFLTVATSVVGGVGVVAAAVPFVASMQPSARARAAGAPVEVDISKIEPGGIAMVEGRGKAIAVVRRTPEMQARTRELDRSEEHTSELQSR